MSTPNPILKSLYTANASAVGGREGRAKTDDGSLDVAIVMPRSLGGSGGEGTNPEQLFAAGYAACFGSALAYTAKQQKLVTGPVTIDAHVTIGAIASGGFGLAVKLVAHVPELGRAEAEALVATAHQVCPYSNATRGNIAVDIELA